MPQTDAMPDDRTDGFSGFATRLRSLFTLRRLGLSIAGTLAFAGAAAALHANNPTPAAQTKADSRGITTSQQQSSTSSPSDSSSQQAADTSGSTNTTFTSNTSDGQTSVNLNVNGQNIPVAPNSSTQQTVTGADGAQTTVNASSNVSTQGTASNSSSSSLTINLNSSSSGGSGGQ